MALGLRFINRGFCRSASIRLFRTIHTKLSSSQLQQNPNHWASSGCSKYCKVSIVLPSRRSRWLWTNLDNNRLHTFSYSRRPRCPTSSMPLQLPESVSTQYLIPRRSRTPVHRACQNIFRYVPFPSLKELDLALPLTHDFATLEL